VDLILGDIETQFIAFSEGKPALNSAARQPHAEGVGMMVAGTAGRTGAMNPQCFLAASGAE
jgi:hypothetical protein